MGSIHVEEGMTIAFLTEEHYEMMAAELHEAYRTKRGLAPLTERYPDMSEHDAYRIQLHYVKLRVESGRRIVGKKIGLTSKAMQAMLHVDQPDYGHLFDDMLLPEGKALARDELLQPRVEPEIAFYLKEDLSGPGLNAAKVLAATQFVLPALEIIDSRIADWRIKLPDTVADNASSAKVVLGGRPLPVDACDLRLMGMLLEKNGQPVQFSCGAAVMGHPAEAIAWLGNKLYEYGVSLEAGEIILPGACCAAIEIERGDHIRATFDRLGSVGLTVV